MEEKFKYASSVLNTVVGIVCLGIGIIFFVLFIVLINFNSSLITILVMINVILDLVFGIFYLNLYKRDYVVINSIGIRIGLKSGKEYKIRMNNLTIRDLEDVK